MFKKSKPCPPHPGDLNIFPSPTERIGNPSAVIPYRDRFWNKTILVGSEGSGKTSMFLHMIEHDLELKDHPLIFVTPKSCEAERVVELTKKAGRSYVYFDVANEDCPTIEPFEGDDSYGEIGWIFNQMGLFGDGSYSQYCRDVFQNIVWVLKKLESQGEAKVDLALLFQTLDSRESVSKLREMDDAIPSQYNPKDFCKITNWITMLLTEPSLFRILNSSGSGSKLNLEAAIENREVIVLCTQCPVQYQYFLSQLIFRELVTVLFDLKRCKKGRNDIHLFLYLDELHQHMGLWSSDLFFLRPYYHIATCSNVVSLHLPQKNAALQEVSDLILSHAGSWDNVILFPKSYDAQFFATRFTKQFRKHEKNLNPIQKFWRRLTKRDDNENCFTAAGLFNMPPNWVCYQLYNQNEIQLPGMGRVEYIKSNKEKLW